MSNCDSLSLLVFFMVSSEQIKDDKANKEKAPKDELKASWDRKKGLPESKPQNGERVQELTTHKLKHTENIFG